VQFVTNVAFASAVLKERVTRGALAATALIVGGCALLVAFGDHASAALAARDLVALYAE
jgi:drug/metabolite transporter (DMT)-like permease